ncbi:MAG TPA: type IV pilus secretin PilQ [Polyangiaceae bacterium]|nr:type IV pilus secretin PilQ [Polyangiaceae bacterium]
MRSFPRHLLLGPASLAAPLAFMLGLGLASTAQAAESERKATHVEVSKAGAAETRIVVSFDASPTFTARLDRQKNRLIVDVPQAVLEGVPPALTERIGIVGGVMAQSFAVIGGHTTRLLVTLLEEAAYGIAVEGNSLVIRVAPKRLGLPAAAPSSANGAAAPAAKAPTATRVRDVRFEHASDEDRVFVELGEDTEFREPVVKDGRARLVLEGARLPDELVRELDVSAFGGGVSSVSSYAGQSEPNTVVLEAEVSKGVTSRVQRRGNSLVWTFADPAKQMPSQSGVARDGGIARRTRTVTVEDAVRDVPRVYDGYSPEQGLVERTAGADAAGFAPSALGQQRNFTGRRIDLDLKDADIHNVLRLLADVGQVNVVTADNVTGSVTIKMRNVPWDQALDVVLQSKGLGMVRGGNMIRVAPLADLEKERELQLARRAQEVKLAPLETRLIPVSYASAKEIQERARPLLSERGTLAVDDRTNVLIARDIAGNLNQIEELIRSLDTQTPQVLVEARIVEATSRYLRDVGIQWGGDGTFSAATGNPTGLAFPNSVGVVGGASDANTPTAGLSPFANTVASPNFAVNLPAAVGTGSGGAIGLSLGSVDNTVNLAVRLSAAEASGLLRILSSPRILTLDNHEARIAQGTLIPFSQVSAQGVQTTFQEAKLQLLVQPHVTADGSVSMHVKINRDEPDFNQTSARGDPTILKREAETELLVMDGHTAVIGGIYTRNTGRNLDQVPFFGDIPLLGLLFQRRRASDQRSELVIFLTPRIVNRAEALGR